MTFIRFCITVLYCTVLSTCQSVFFAVREMPTEPKNQSGLLKKRQTRRGEERTDEVLRAASDLFLEKGYELTSLDEIIRRSGGSKSHVYGVFGGKEELFLAVVTSLCDEVQLSVLSLDLSEKEIETSLLRLARGLVAVLLGERHVALQRLVFAEAGRFPEAGRIWFEKGPQATRAIFTRFLARCMQAGTLRQADPQLAANQLEDMLSGHLLDRRCLRIGKAPGKKEIDQVITSAVQLFLFGYSVEGRLPQQ